RLVEEEFELQLRRHLRLDAGHCLADPADHAQGRGPLALENGHQHRPAPVAPHDVSLYRVAVANVCHVLDVDGYAVDRLDGNLVKGFNNVRAAVELDVVLSVTHLRCPGRDDEVLVG